MLEKITTHQKVTALTTLRQVVAGKDDSILMDTVVNLLVVAVTQLETRVIELEKQNVWSL